MSELFTWPCGCKSPAGGGDVVEPCAECKEDGALSYTERLRRLAKADFASNFANWVLAKAVATKPCGLESILFAGRQVLASPDLKSWYDPDNGRIYDVAEGYLNKVRS